MGNKTNPGYINDEDQTLPSDHTAMGCHKDLFNCPQLKVKINNKIGPARDNLFQQRRKSFEGSVPSINKTVLFRTRFA